jgi:hypothetical protein
LYFSEDQLMAVDVSEGAIGDSVSLIRGRYGSGGLVGTQHDVHPDEDRFRMTLDTVPV